MNPPAAPATAPPLPRAVTVVLPTHNPDRDRLRRTLRGLRAQTLAAEQWETIVVDNASAPALAAADWAADAPAKLRVVREPSLGLTAARCAGFAAARGDLIVLVDDDNVLAPGYLAEVQAIFARQPRLGAAGGKSRPVFLVPPAPWQGEFFPLLAVRDLGEREQVAPSLRPEGSAQAVYPACAPIGAGMALRREAARAWSASLAQAPERRCLDRRGPALVSGGDNDIVLTVLGGGWEVGYFPTLVLEHLIPPERLDPGYLARLNRALQRSWVQVLALHQANPWPRIARWTVPLRCGRAYFRHQAWRSPAHHIRWQGVCGRFEGQALA